MVDILEIKCANASRSLLRLTQKRREPCHQDSRRFHSCDQKLTDSDSTNQHCLCHSVRQVTDLVSLTIDAPTFLYVARERAAVSDPITCRITTVTPMTMALAHFDP